MCMGNEACAKCCRVWGTRGAQGGEVRLYCRGMCKSCYNGKVTRRKTHQSLADPALAVRFWSKVDQRAPEACWPWRASRSINGYGRILLNGKLEVAPRIAWAITHGEDPGPYDVCHSCDNPACCNPAHLWRGTRQQNLRDMVKKRRHGSARLQDVLDQALELLQETIPEPLSEGLRTKIDRFLVEVLASCLRTGSPDLPRPPAPYVCEEEPPQTTTLASLAC